VPRSIDRVLSAWNLAHTRIIEIKFPGDVGGKNFRNSYTRVEEADRLPIIASNAGGFYLQAPWIRLAKNSTTLSLKL
jgi:hypothetical protein